jgi:hypothetical protein
MAQQPFGIDWNSAGCIFSFQNLNVLLILKIQDQKNMNSGPSAGISPYDGKSIHYSLFIYRQHFVDVVELRSLIIMQKPGKKNFKIENLSDIIIN